ncbi:MAG: DUF5946 family protein [Woeseiaceae bacterium]
MKSRCMGCGGLFDDEKGPVHDYMLSSPGCWAQYGLILAREYQNPELFASAHRLTVDAYALQHPGKNNERRAYQSVRIHYTSLHLIFAHDLRHAEATEALKQLAQGSFSPLTSRPSDFEVTVSDVLKSDLENHAAAVARWARCAYDRWDVLMPYAETLIKTL